MNPPVVLIDRLARWLGYVPPRLTPAASARLVRLVEGPGLHCTCQRLMAAGWKVVSCPACSLGVPAASIGVSPPGTCPGPGTCPPDAEGAARRPERAEAIRGAVVRPAVRGNDSCPLCWQPKGWHGVVCPNRAKSARDSAVSSSPGRRSAVDDRGGDTGDAHGPPGRGSPGDEVQVSPTSVAELLLTPEMQADLAETARRRRSATDAARDWPVA